MARTYELDTDAEAVKKDLTRAFQSAHINFIIGAGASQPAIPIAGGLEQEIEQLMAQGDGIGARAKLFDLLTGVQQPTNVLLAGGDDANVSATLDAYTALLQTIELILTERRTTLLQKQATIFTTNYDVFVDVAARSCGTALLATGFDRVPAPDGISEYSAGRFFLATYAAGTLYDYRVELPTVNLVKLHGCLSWRRVEGRIELCSAARALLGPQPQAADIEAFLETFALVLPLVAKFPTTVLDRTYYELLRLYANALDKENVLLIAFGFSFRDEHILHITLRALRNPTLRLVVIAYDAGSRAAFLDTFAPYSNVIIVVPVDGEVLGSDRFNALLSACIPRRVDA